MFQYRQVRSLISLLMKKSNVPRPLTKFKALLTTAGRPKLLSRLYIILSTNVTTTEREKAKWEKDLGVKWTDEEWYELRKCNQSSSKSVLIQDNRFKILHLWRLTPQRIKKMLPLVDSKC